MILRSLFSDFDPDQCPVPALSVRVDVSQNEGETPLHSHRKGQLVVALRGGITCDVPGARWMVPPQSGVWIPGGLQHSNRATANAVMCLLFIEPRFTVLPERCCTISIGPMVREMILWLTKMPRDYGPETHCGRLARVLLEELGVQPVEDLSLPISNNPKLKLIADALTRAPADRTSLSGWANRVALSERSLSRLVERELGLTFGQWRQQIHLMTALRELSGGAKVHQVAATLGYNSSTAFITMFRKALGTSPAKYFQDRDRYNHPSG
jgi:AraC-like DNA-binding protein